MVKFPCSLMITNFMITDFVWWLMIDLLLHYNKKTMETVLKKPSATKQTHFKLDSEWWNKRQSWFAGGLAESADLSPSSFLTTNQLTGTNWSSDMHSFTKKNTFNQSHSYTRWGDKWPLGSQQPNVKMFFLKTEPELITASQNVVSESLKRKRKPTTAISLK